MNRRVLTELFRQGMRYPPGRRRLWVIQCFEIAVQPGEVVAIDEYAGSAIEDGETPMQPPRPGEASGCQMLHVGRSILHLTEGRVIEKPGARGIPKH